MKNINKCQNSQIHPGSNWLYSKGIEKEHDECTAGCKSSPYNTVTIKLHVPQCTFINCTSTTSSLLREKFQTFYWMKAMRVKPKCSEKKKEKKDMLHMKGCFGLSEKYFLTKEKCFFWQQSLLCWPETIKEKKHEEKLKCTCNLSKICFKIRLYFRIRKNIMLFMLSLTHARAHTPTYARVFLKN